MSDTADKLKKAFQDKQLKKSDRAQRLVVKRLLDKDRSSRLNKRMSESKHSEYEDRIFRAKRNPNSKHSREALSLLEDMVDSDRYYSSRKREPIPYERQRELQISKPKQPLGPSVSREEAYRKYRQNQRPRNKN